MFLRTLLLLTISFCVFAQSLMALGPWKAQVVDADTKQPLPGVVVIAVWKRYWPAPDVVGTFGYVDSEEAVTDTDGRFAIAARNFSAVDAFILEEPDFYL